MVYRWRPRISQLVDADNQPRADKRVNVSKVLEMARSRVGRPPLSGDNRRARAAREANPRRVSRSWTNCGSGMPPAQGTPRTARGSVGKRLGLCQILEPHGTDRKERPLENVGKSLFPLVVTNTACAKTNGNSLRRPPSLDGACDVRP